MSVVALKLSAVSKTYPGVRALSDMNLECLAGEVHAVLGENGSGKSTLLGIASGTVTPDGGVIEIMGRPLTAADPLQARSLGLATVYQDDSLVRELTVAQNLLLAATDDSISYGAMNGWAEKQLAAYDLDLAPDAVVGDLTPAERQFLEIVKALISRPKVLLLDEPTSTLDLDGVRKLSAIVRRLAAEGTAIVYVSHRLPEILDLADRVTILRDGVGQGTHIVSEALSVNDLIALMVGRSIEAEYPAKTGRNRSGAGRRRPFRRQFPRRFLFGAARRDPRFRRRRGQRPARRHPRAGRPRRMLRRHRRQRRADPMRHASARPCRAGCSSSAPTALRNRYSRSSACART